MPCNLCNAPSRARVCQKCVYEYVEKQLPGAAARALIAKSGNQKRYPDICATHGSELFNVATRNCVQCDKENAPLVTVPRAVARITGATLYKEECEKHGQTLHYVRNGKCCLCFTINGTERATLNRDDSERAVARRIGLKQFMENCATHGPTMHNVQHGKCLRCYNAMGYRRPHPRPWEAP